MDFLANPVYLFESHGFTLFKGRLLICGKRTSRERFYAFSLALRKGFFVCVSLRPGEIWVKLLYGFPDSSVGKESACNAGDPGSIPGSGSFPGEGIGYPLQYSWVSLVVQLVKNPPTMRETWVQSLGWEDPLEKGKANHSSILAWKIPWTVESTGSQRVGRN